MLAAILLLKQLNASLSKTSLVELQLVLSNLEYIFSHQIPRWPMSLQYPDDGILYIPNDFFNKLINHRIPKVSHIILEALAKFQEGHMRTDEEREELGINELADINSAFQVTVTRMKPAIDELDEEIIRMYNICNNNPELYRASVKDKVKSIEQYITARYLMFNSFFAFLGNIEAYALNLIKTKFPQFVVFTKSKKNKADYLIFITSFAEVLKNLKNLINLMATLNEDVPH